VNDPDRTITFSSIQKDNGAFLPKSNGLEDAWTNDEFTTDEDRPTIERGATFVSLAFIAGALKRSAWLWCVTALFGVIIGYGLYAKFPPAYSATTSVLVTNSPNADAATQSNTNVVLAESQAVAERALQDLGVHQTVGSLLAAYTVTAPATQVIVFQVNAPSSSEALQRASALAAAFLQFRADYLDSQQQIQVTLAEQQVTQAQQKLSSIDRQIAELPASSPELSGLQAQQTTAQNALGAAQQYSSTIKYSGALTTASMVKGSQILNSPTPARQSFKKSRLFYLVLALFAGFAIGVVIVIIRALVSERLRNRDDIADAIGAPIMLSIGQVGTKWLPPLGKRAGMRAIDVKRLVAHLNSAVTPPPAKRFASLAVVVVDNAKEMAPAVVSLAMTWANQGKQVVLADLADGAPAARQFGVKGQGVHTAGAHGVNLVVSVPRRDDPAPVGPVPTPSHPQFGHVNADLAAACASADFLLTLVTLDPLSGGDHLASWANEVIAVVTAGRSSATRIRAVGEMIRLAGTRLVSVVLLKADKSDESLGMLAAMEQSVSSL
jgi:capsular polysaccharide biosynthesis protein